MHKLNKILTIGLLSILFSINGYCQGTKIETSKLIVSNDFVVVSNATLGKITLGGETRTNWPTYADTNSYQPFTSTVMPDAGGTCTIAYANGNLVQIYQPAKNITLTFNTATYATNGVSYVGVMIYSLTNSISLDYNTCTNDFTGTPVKSTTGWTRWLFWRVGNETFKGRQ